MLGRLAFDKLTSSRRESTPSRRVHRSHTGVSVTPFSSLPHESKKILKTASTIDAELKVSDGVGAPRGPQIRRTAETTSNKRLESTFVLQQMCIVLRARTRVLPYAVGA